MLIPKLQEESFLDEIDIPWALACLEERFDDAILILNEGCLIYGGAIRDIIADMPIHGDLDIAIPYNQYQNIMRKFDNSPRWVRKPKAKSLFVSKIQYSEQIRSLIKNMITYNDLSGAEVQLIQSSACRGMGDTKYDEGIMNLVHNVDLLCSGIIMDINGKVTEVLPGAVKDCENRELNLNKEIDRKLIDVKVLRNRIQKLVKRGWKNNINIEQFKEK